MKQSKSIFERIKLNRTNYIRNRKQNSEKKKEINENLPKSTKKTSKIKNFFKFIIGFIISFFEYLIINSNKKRFKNDNANRNDSFKEFVNVKISKTSNLSDSLIKKNEDDIKLTNIKETENKEDLLAKSVKTKTANISSEIENISKNNIELEKNINSLTKKITNVNNQKNDLVQTKKDLIIVEEKIIYADNNEELEQAKTKILTTKKELQLRKNNNIDDLNKLAEDKKNNILKDNVALDSNFIAESSNDKSLEKNLSNNNLFNEKILQIHEKNEDNNLEIDKLIKKCDESLIIIEEKKQYIELQQNYEQYLNDIDYNKNFKISKKDLRQIKNNVNSILERQKYNLEQFNKYIQMPSESKIFISKVSNFFKSTAKLSFSIVPFLAFPNKLIGLTTSALLFNNSIKSYRMKPNINYINQHISLMLSNNANCLKVGLRTCEDSLNEIDTIKYYLSSLPSGVKDTLEYRKYLVDVNATETLVKKQIQCLKKLSKNYDNIKVKVKMREY